MNTKLFAIVIAIVVFICPRLKAQTKPLQNSLLWEVSGKGLKKPSYIYGAFHMMCAEDFFIPENLKAAIAKVNRVSFEVDISDPAYMTKIQQSMMSAVPMSKKLTPQQFKSLDSLITLQLPYTLKQLDNLSIQAISSLLTMKVIPCSTAVSYESELLKFAQQLHKPIGGLESVQFQMDCYRKAYSDEFMFEQTLHPEKMKTELQAMTALYKKQDLNGLYSYIINKDNAEPQTEKWLLQTRNNNWVAAMPALMQKEPILFAVGSAHLGGTYSIINLLKAQGYTVKPIYK